jgi:inhibitor of cysteine peptidase
MRRNMLGHRLVMAALGAAACLWGTCHGAPQAPSPTAPKQATGARFVAVEQKASGSLVAIAQGATLVLRLKSNPTTGYSWQIATHDATLLRPIGPPRYVRPQTLRMGAGGYQEFRFEARATGETTLTLNYARPFEKNAPPARTYSLTLNIGNFGVLAHQIIIVTDADESGVVDLARGTLLTVSLPSNPTTGYGWQVASDSAQRLRSTGKPVYVAPARTLPGAGGYQEFLFEAASPGDTTLVLMYKRPFEPKARPAKTFRLTASIRG